MVPINQGVTVYQLRVALLRTRYRVVRKGWIWARLAEFIALKHWNAGGERRISLYLDPGRCDGRIAKILMEMTSVDGLSRI